MYSMLYPSMVATGQMLKFCAELDPDATYDDSTNHAIEQWEKLIYIKLKIQKKKNSHTNLI